MTDIGYGVEVATAALHQISVFSTTPLIYARSLIRCVFHNDELLAGSLTGRQSNTNVGKEAYPQLEVKKVNAVIGKLVIHCHFKFVS